MFAGVSGRTAAAQPPQPPSPHLGCIWFAVVAQGVKTEIPNENTEAVGVLADGSVAAPLKVHLMLHLLLRPEMKCAATYAKRDSSTQAGMLMPISLKALLVDVTTNRDGFARSWPLEIFVSNVVTSFSKAGSDAVPS